MQGILGNRSLVITVVIYVGEGARGKISTKIRIDIPNRRSRGEHYIRIWSEPYVRALIRSTVKDLPVSKIQLILSKETICINYSLTARRHALNQCLKLRLSYILPCFLHSAPEYIIAHNFRKVILKVILHDMPDPFNRIQVRRKRRPRNSLGSSFL
jgi:hypothetical protein